MRPMEPKQILTRFGKLEMAAHIRLASLGRKPMSLYEWRVRALRKYRSHMDALVARMARESDASP